MPAWAVDEAFIAKVELAVPPAGRKTLPGVSCVDGPGGETPLDRFTVPAKPLKLASVMVDCPDDLGVSVMEFGTAERAKSGPAYSVTVVTCTIGPLTPVTLMLYVPGDVELLTEMSRLEVPVPPEDKGTMLGVSVAETPAGSGPADRVTSPEKPPTLARVIEDIPEDPS